jgi:hypothetical protein
MNAITTTSANFWYADGLRWIGSIFNTLADQLDDLGRDQEADIHMPRHISYDEIVGEVRNRMYTGFGSGNRPYY